MSGVTAFIGVCAAILIAVGIDLVVPVGELMAAVLEVTGVVLAVAFFGLADGA